MHVVEDREILAGTDMKLNLLNVAVRGRAMFFAVTATMVVETPPLKDVRKVVRVKKRGVNLIVIIAQKKAVLSNAGQFVPEKASIVEKAVLEMQPN